MFGVRSKSLNNRNTQPTTSLNLLSSCLRFEHLLQCVDAGQWIMTLSFTLQITRSSVVYPVSCVPFQACIYRFLSESCGVRGVPSPLFFHFSTDRQSNSIVCTLSVLVLQRPTGAAESEGLSVCPTIGGRAGTAIFAGT